MVTRTKLPAATGGTGEWTEESRDPLQRSVETVWSGTGPVASRTCSPATAAPGTAAAPGSRGRLASATDADGVSVCGT